MLTLKDTFSRELWEKSGMSLLFTPTRVIILEKWLSGYLWLKKDVALSAVEYPDGVFCGEKAEKNLQEAVHLIWFHGEGSYGQTLYRKLESLEEFGVDMSRVRALCPTAPLRKKPYDTNDPEDQYSRMYYTYSPDRYGNIDAMCQINQKQVFEYVDNIRDQLKEWSFRSGRKPSVDDSDSENNDKAGDTDTNADKAGSERRILPKLVVAGSSLGGVVALQVGMELGADLVFLQQSCPCIPAFDIERVRTHRPSNAPKTKLLAGCGGNDTTYPPKVVYKEMTLLAKQCTADILDEPVLICRNGVIC